MTPRGNEAQEHAHSDRAAHLRVADRNRLNRATARARRRLTASMESILSLRTCLNHLTSFYENATDPQVKEEIARMMYDIISQIREGIRLVRRRFNSII
jgi:hypothetical protein